MSTSLRHVLRQAAIAIKPPADLDAKQKVIVTYRYISWFITSIYYLTGPPFNSFKYKLAVVIALFVFGRVIMDYYLKSEGIQAIRITAMVETIGITLLLIPTGGIESPFIWYALNPVLIASSYIEGIYCWVNLFFYLLASLVISINLFNSQDLTVIELIENKSYVIFAYFLVTIAMKLLARLVNQLDHQAKELQEQKEKLVHMNEQLNEANISVKRSMEYVMSLYHIIETFSSRESTYTLLKQMVQSTSKIMDCQTSFIWFAAYKEEPSRVITHGMSFSQESTLYYYLEGSWADTNLPQKIHVFPVMGKEYLLAPIKSTSRFYGYIGIGLAAEKKVAHEKNYDLLNFIGDLVAIIQERNRLEKSASKFIILEEQNRIGNEMHDNVSQRLFSILYGIHAINASWNRLNAEEIQSRLGLIEQSIRETSADLRTSIYRLSSSKRGEVVFKDNLGTYLRDFESLNQINVNFEFLGEEERISSSLKQAIYRIIREATGNAVRHGKCSELEVRLIAHTATLELAIKDNGKGFDALAAFQNKENRGLGLSNMLALTQTFNGTFEIRSSEATGTKLEIKVPLGDVLNIAAKKQGGVA